MPRVNLSNAYRSLTNDIVTTFYFSSSNNLIEQKNFAAEFHRACEGFLRLLAFIRQFGFVGYILTLMSRWYQHLLKPAPKLRSILEYQQVRIGLERSKNTITLTGIARTSGLKSVLRLRSTGNIECRRPSA